MTELLKAEAVRDRMKLRSTATIYRWAKQGILPAVVLSSRAIRFREEDVEAFIASRSTAAAK